MNGWKILSSYSKPLKMVGYSIFTLYLFRRSVSIPCIHECVRVCVFVFWKKQQHNARHWKLTTFSLYETDMWTVARVRALYGRRECVLNSTLNICFQHIRTCFLSSFSCHNVCQVSFFHSMSAFASIFRNLYNGAFSIEWFVYFEIPNRNRLNFPFHWEILQSICGFVTQKKVMITKL